MRGKSTALFYVSFHPIKPIINIDFYDFMKKTRKKKPTLTISSFHVKPSMMLQWIFCVCLLLCVYVSVIKMGEFQIGFKIEFHSLFLMFVKSKNSKVFLLCVKIYANTSNTSVHRTAPHAKISLMKQLRYKWFRANHQVEMLCIRRWNATITRSTF